VSLWLVVVFVVDGHYGVCRYSLLWCVSVQERECTSV